MSDVEVVVGDLNPAPKPSAPKPKAVAKWESDAREALKTGIRRIAKPLTEMISRDANEGDTRLLVTDFLCEALGYDKYENLTTEYQVKGEFADYGLRIDKQLVAFLEVKRATTKLNVRHLRQVEMYAVNEGVEWVILTNANDWQVYHLTGGLPVVIDLVMSVNLLGEGTANSKVDQLFYLSREALRRREIDELWLARRATSPKSLSTALMSEPVTTALRKELKRTMGHAVTHEELVGLLRTTVLRPECFGDVK
jgi:predicted type IV restriction endonuclease